jgi:hypothetical protein
MTYRLQFNSSYHLEVAGIPLYHHATNWDEVLVFSLAELVYQTTHPAPLDFRAKNINYDSMNLPPLSVSTEHNLT